MQNSFFKWMHFVWLNNWRVKLHTKVISIIFRKMDTSPYFWYQFIMAFETVPNMSNIDWEDPWCCCEFMNYDFLQTKRMPPLEQKLTHSLLPICKFAQVSGFADKSPAILWKLWKIDNRHVQKCRSMHPLRKFRIWTCIESAICGHHQEFGI